MDTFDKYHADIIAAKTLEEISAAKDEYIKALQNEINELRGKTFLANSFVELYIARGYYESKKGEYNELVEKA